VGDLGWVVGTLRGRIERQGIKNTLKPVLKEVSKTCRG